MLLVEYVARYATKEAADAAEDGEDEGDDMSSISYVSSEDEADRMEL